HFAGCHRLLARFPAVVTLQIKNVLIGGHAEIVIRERPHQRWQPGNRDSEGPQVAILKVGVTLAADARQQGCRQAPHIGALGFLDASVSYQNAEISLQSLLNSFTQSEAIRSLLLRGAEREGSEDRQQENGAAKM